MTDKNTYAAFAGDRLLKAGPLTDVLAAVKLARDSGETRTILIFNDQSGKEVDFDFRGSLDEVLERAKPKPAAKGPGRPRLGVESREVTLLPRHWAWLQRQPSGASAALRRLVEEASRVKNPNEESRRARDAAYSFMSAIAGNRAGFEEAARALYAGDMTSFAAITDAWPADIRAHLSRLLTPANAEAA